jgi:hypothetical protein
MYVTAIPRILLCFIGNFLDACLLDRCHTACMDCASISDLDTADRDALVAIFALEITF